MKKRFTFKDLRPLLILSACLSGATALGSDFQSPRTAALGGAGHAGPFLDDAIYLNPSYASLIPTESGAFNYFSYKGPDQSNSDGSTSHDPHGHGFNASLQDGTSNLFQGGVGFTEENDGTRMVNIGASKAVIKQIGIGLGSKIIFNQPNGAPTISDGTFSVTGIISNKIQSALIVDNILQTAAGRNRNLYREVILGTKFNISSLLLLYLDPHIAPSYSQKYGHELGAELAVFQGIYLRGGTFLNSYIPIEEARGNGFSMGFGWVGPKISMDYALQRVQTPQQCIVQNLGLSFYL